MSDLKQQKSLFGASIPFIFEPKITEGYLTQEQRQTARYGAKDLPGVTVAKAETAEVVAEAPKAETPASKKAESPLQNDRPGNDKPDLTRNSANSPQFDPQPQPAPQAIKPIGIAPGALSMYQRQQAQAQPQHDSTNKPSVVDQSTAFKVGLAATGSAASIERMNKRMLEETIDGHIEADNEQDAADLYIQQQIFMRSAEYRIALDSTNECIQRLERRAEELHTQIAETQERLDQMDAEIAQDQQKIDAKEEHVAGLEEVAAARDEHKEDLRKEQEMWERNDAINEEAFKLQRNTVKIIGKDVYVTTTENGQTTLYKVDESGQKVKVEDKDRPFFDPFQDTYFRRQTADGKTEYINAYGMPVSQQEKDKIDKALKAAGVKPEDALSDRDEFIRKQNEARAQTEREGVSDSDMWQHGKITDASKARMDAAAEKMGIPPDRMDQLEKMIEDGRNDLAKLREDLQKKIDTRNGTAAELAAAKEELEYVKDDLVKAHEFRRRLERREFKNEKEMVDAMPQSLKDDYERKKSLEQKTKGPSATADQSTPQASAQPAPQTVAKAETPAGTSRATGSAAASIEGDGQIKAGADKKLSEQYQAAATAVPADSSPANTATPEEQLVAAAAAKAATPTAAFA